MTAPLAHPGVAPSPAPGGAGPGSPGQLIIPGGLASESVQAALYRVAGINPAPTFVLPGMQLILAFRSANNSVTLSVRYRQVLLEGGEVVSEYQFNPGLSFGVEAFQFFPLAAGWLVNLDVQTTGTQLQRGLLFMRAMLGPVSSLGSQRYVTLARGYVQAPGGLHFPGQNIYDAAEGPGSATSRIGNTPGAGGEISETVATGLRWRLKALRAQLVTSAVVANRFPKIIIDDGATEVARTGFSTAVPASSTVIFSAFPGAAAANLANGGVQIAPLPDVYMLPGWRWRTITSGLDVGDQWSVIGYTTEEWFSP